MGYKNNDRMLIWANKDFVKVMKSLFPSKSMNKATKEITPTLEMKLFNKKKGSIMDIIFIAVFILMISVATLVAFKISTEFKNEFDANPDINAEGKRAYTKVNNIYPNVLDNSILILVVGLAIVALSLAAMVKVHPVFFIFYLLVFAVIMVLSAAFSNIYIHMANQTEMTAVAEELTFTTHIMGFLPPLVGIFGSF